MNLKIRQFENLRICDVANTWKYSIKLFSFFFLFIFTGKIYGQVITTSNADSSIIITKDARFDELVRKQKDQGLLNQSMHGYRIQIYFGGVRQKASEVKLDFNSRYPDLQAYLSYQQPNFKVRIGDYRSRYEAQKFLKEIEGLYPTSFIVPDEVRLPPLK